MDKSAQTKMMFAIFLCLLVIGGLTALIVSAWVVPVVTLHTPVSGKYLTSGNDVQFNFSYSNSTSNETTLANATLFLNGAQNVTQGNSTGRFRNSTSGNFSSKGQPSLTVPIMPDGVYLWNVRIENVSTYQWWGVDNYTLTIDSTSPEADIQSPTNNQYVTTNALTVIAMCNETYPNGARLWVNGRINITTPYANSTNISFAGVSGFANGENVSYAVSCLDLAGNEAFANGTRYYDLENPTVESNITDGHFFAIGATQGINFTVRDSPWIDNCTLWGDFNRTRHARAGKYQSNGTVYNQSSGAEINISSGAQNVFVTLDTLDTNRTSPYTWNIKCYSRGNRKGTLGSNRTLHVDTTVPTVPVVQYLSTELETNTTSTVRRWINMTINITTTDATPYIRWKTVRDNYSTTVRITFDGESPTLATPDYIFTNDSNSYNYSLLGLSPSRPSQTYYYAINVTDQAGNHRWGGDSETLENTSIYRVSSYGANLTGGMWNPIGVARDVGESTSYKLNLSSILKETGATYVAIYNKTHDFVTCSSTSMATYFCRINVSRSDPVWIYVDSNSSWDYSWWDSNRTAPGTTGYAYTFTPNMSNLGWGISGGILNFTNITSGWNYFSIMNFTDGCSYKDINTIMNSSLIPLGTVASAGFNVNQTGTGNAGAYNITYMSTYNINGSDTRYYPYFFDFGSPWQDTQLDFRQVVAVWNNGTGIGNHKAMYYNRTGC